MAEDIIRENSEDGIELSDESLDSIAGGYVLNNGADYEVIDGNGDVVETIQGTTVQAHERALRLRRRPRARAQAARQGVEPALPLPRLFLRGNVILTRTWRTT